MRVANTKPDIERLVTYLQSLGIQCIIAFEPTGDYHRAVMHRLGRAGLALRQVSSLAVARTRDAMYNSWDKNDPKDAQVILHLLKTGTTQRFVDPHVSGHHDLQEMANTYQQVSLRKVRLQHAIVTHHLPLYFPEAERYRHSSRAEWFTDVLRLTPCPAAVRAYTKPAFIAAARAQVRGQKTDKTRWPADVYDTAGRSVALPVQEDSAAIRMFRVVLEEYQQLCRRRKALEIIDALRATPISTGCRPYRASDRSWPSSSWPRPGIFDPRARPAVSQVLWLRSVHRAVGAVSRSDASVEARERAPALRLLDGRRGRSPHAAEQLSPV